MLKKCKNRPKVWKIFCMAAVFLCLGGCGGQEISTEEGQEITDVSDVSNGLGVESKKEFALPDEKDVSQFGEQQSEHAGQTAEQETGQEGIVSEERNTAVYDREHFFELNMEVGNDGIYAFGRKDKGGEYVLFYINAEDGLVRNFELTLESELNGRAACVDSLGNLHLLLSRRGDSEGVEILEVDKEGQLVNRIDLTDIIDKSDLTDSHMTMGDEGEYYIGCNHSMGSSIIVLDSEGKQVESVSLDSVLAGLGTGGSGRIYGMLYGVDGQYLGMLTENGEMEPCLKEGFEGKPIKITCLRPGVHCELLLGNGVYGAWEYEEGSLTQVVSADEMPYKGEEIAIFGFLNDGRLCIAGYRDGVYTVECLPAERIK